jgi:hypothetical protein
MKKLYLRTFLFFVSVCPTYLAIANPDPVIEKDKLEDIKSQIVFSEYFIRWQNTATAYQSPNRNNNLQATYTGQEMTITPIGSRPDWAFSLMLKSIAADDRQICKPVKDPLIFLHDNTIRFDHNGKFTVEYVNTQQGVRQNFIIQQPASNPARISVQLQVAEGWNAAKQSATSLSFKHGKQQLSYDGLKVWDAKGNALPAHFSVTNNLVRIEVDACNAIYPITIDPLVANATPQNANLTLQGNQVGAGMGWSVAGAGDINNDGFDDVIVGAPNYTSGQPREGAAFVYYGSLLGINPTTYTMLQSDVDSAQFGYTVAAAGHVNYDDYGDVVIGSPYTRISPMAGFAGRFYVFNGASTGITTSPDAIIDGSASHAFLGEILSSAGDVNGDTYDDIVAGEWGAQNQHGGYGKVWIYYGGPFGIQYTVPTLLQGNIPSGIFGRSAAGAGDVNGDGFADVLLGSIGGPAVTFKGSVNIYYGNPNGLDTVPNVILAGHTQNFGYKVAAAGNINGDAYGDILISSMQYFFPFGDTVFIYHGSSTGIHTTPDAAIPSPQDTTAYGVSIAGAGDLNNDGFDDIIIGSSEGHNGQDNEGIAYVHYGRAIGINPVPGATIQSNQTNASLGFCVAGAGDVNNDGRDDIIVGAPTYSLPQLQEGVAFIYHGVAVSAGFTTTDILSQSPLSSVLSPDISVRVFPNPVVDNLSLQFEGLNADYNTYIQILNTQGMPVKTIPIGKMKTGSQQIDIAKLIPGLYFIVVQNGSKTFREKIIKQ